MPFNDVVKRVQCELVFNNSPQIGSERRRQDLEVRFEIGVQIEYVAIGKKDASAFRGLGKIVKIVRQPLSIFGAHIVVLAVQKFLQ